MMRGSIMRFAQSKRGSAVAGRLCLHCEMSGNNPFNIYRLAVLAKENGACRRVKTESSPKNKSPNRAC
jgi:hypothetical protein